ncbi:hypothetical protein EJ04DRAFT_493156 [Polyplosphaeria fusca]|uniref:F-box domain-containing protein n=1 Tax=Polyplosphaeria fusca TaxID=682080 RepID=A0A9P4R0Q8_9PLEO|nr:hypothetical protein EJ04DRAFT_493156 [Polyplosphaeria fusca]
MNSTEAELESFRKQWREEVTAKAKGKAPAAAGPSISSTKERNAAPEAHSHARHPSVEEVDEVEPHAYHDLGEKQHGRRLDETGPPTATSSQEPETALEHYEKAVEKESQGSLGDSVNLYRKAFRLDHKVHETYKQKHFPPSSFSKPKPQDPNPSNAPVTVPSTAHHSLEGLPSSLQPIIASFATLSILGEAPPTDLSPVPPCPISTIPEEILAEILVHLAVKDLSSFVRLAQVCKRLAYLVATEDRVWKRIALGHEYGFAGMHYDWACQLDGKPLGGDDDEGGLTLDPPLPSDQTTSVDPAMLTALLVPSTYSSYRTLFRSRPRLRFNGCYISTVNYTRPGASSPTSVSWNSPIHIVTYYRYLRFLRNGTCISLLTTSEPADVVPYLHPEHMHKNHGNLPSAPMKDALLGRWKLSGPRVPGEDGEGIGEREGVLHVETAGVTPKYMYKMVLATGSAGKGARNNKLTWMGYWSYNKLTDDWCEFGLKNDRAFYWSRVRSYGMGWDHVDL